MYRLAVFALLATSVSAKGGCPSTGLTLEDWVRHTLMMLLLVEQLHINADGAFCFSHLRWCYY